MQRRHKTHQSTRRAGANAPRRDDILKALARSSAPLGFDALAALLNVHGSDARAGLGAELDALVAGGGVHRSRVGDYGLAARMDLVRGRVTGHPDGFGFVIPEEGAGADLFLPAFEMRRVLHGDRVVVRVAGVDRRGRAQGAIVEILERANRTIVGRYFHDGGIGFVVPANPRIGHEVLIPAQAGGHARPGQIVVAEITEQPEQHRQPVGRIIEVLGEHLAPGMEVDIALRVHEVPFVWPATVLAELASVPRTVDARAHKGRLDLRGLPLVTIDGADARDFDDAVYCEPVAGGFRLLVAIADVAHYVKPGTALDAEALLRGNSVYFPNRVIPMLPAELSNGICSLVPQEDRLCLVCDLRFDKRGEVTEFAFHEAVMHSAARLTYTEVAEAVVTRDRATRDRLAHVVTHLEHLYALYRVLRRRRDARGALDLDTVETRIEFNDSGKIARVVAVERNDAHRLIEECMIAANVAAAQFLRAAQVPALYRVHYPPTPEKIEDLRAFLGELGVTFGGRKEPGPKDYAKVLASLGERPDRHLIQTVLLRSLKLAVYSPEPAGHFGLALEAYTHFTSPIRRYPDLQVHRAIRAQIKRATRAGVPTVEALANLGEHCSTTERRADDATRAVIAWLKCEYMQERIGETFAGTVTAVTGFGLFVELAEVYVEGLVHITALPSDYYHFDPIGHRLTGRRSGRTFRLGDPVRVRLTRVNLDERKIDFELAEGGNPAPRRRRR